MTYCNHKWWSPLKGTIIKSYNGYFIKGTLSPNKYRNRQYTESTTPICLECGMSRVYYEYITKLLGDRKSCKHCDGRGYII